MPGIMSGEASAAQIADFLDPLGGSSYCRIPPSLPVGSGQDFALGPDRSGGGGGRGSCGCFRADFGGGRRPWGDDWRRGCRVVDGGSGGCGRRRERLYRFFRRRRSGLNPSLGLAPGRALGNVSGGRRWGSQCGRFGGGVGTRLGLGLFRSGVRCGCRCRCRCRCRCGCGGSRPRLVTLRRLLLEGQRHHRREQGGRCDRQRNLQAVPEGTPTPYEGDPGGSQDGVVQGCGRFCPGRFLVKPRDGGISQIGVGHSKSSRASLSLATA